jgi:hypothetical protein
VQAEQPGNGKSCADSLFFAQSSPAGGCHDGNRQVNTVDPTIGPAISGPSFFLNQFRVKLGTTRPPMNATSSTMTAIDRRIARSPVSIISVASR